MRILPLTAPGTHGEALAALTFARETHVRRLMIVTSPYHTKRSLATFRSVFDGSSIEIGIEPATASSPARPERWWATPYDRAYVAYEWAARAVLRGAIRRDAVVVAQRPLLCRRQNSGVVGRLCPEARPDTAPATGRPGLSPFRPRSSVHESSERPSS